MTEALIVYGTRYGATASTSQVIADSLRQDGFEVKVVNAKKEKVQSITEFDLILVGSGIAMGKWTGEAEDFIKKHKEELSTKAVALFVSCGGANPLSEGENRTREYESGKQKYLEDKVKEFNLKPIALGYFGGCYNFGKMSWFFKKTLSSIKPKLESAGYTESSNGYDLRDLSAIKAWAKELSQRVH
jgi:menaquinone-dependent protoporphyrinogen oxidase